MSDIMSWLRSSAEWFQQDQILTRGLPLVLAASTLAYVLSNTIYQRFFSPLTKFPGPFWASISDLWSFWLAVSGQHHAILIDLHHKHGPVVRTGPNELSITDPQAFKQIYSAGKVFRKAAYYETFRNGRDGDIFAERDEKRHGQDRRRVARAYSKAALKELDSLGDSVVRGFVEKLKSMEGEAMDLCKWFELLAFDYITQLTFGLNQGTVQAGTDRGLFQEFRALTLFATALGQIPVVYRMLKPCFAILERATGSMDGAEEKITAIVNQCLSDRKLRSASGTPQVDLLAVIQRSEPKEFAGTDDSFLMATLGANIVAGTPDIAIVLTTVLNQLLRHPDVKRTLTNELQDRKKRGKLRDIPTTDEIDDCPYFQAILFEAVRLHTSAPGILHREVPRGGMEVCGNYIPEGVVVGTAPWALHRDPNVWGPDAHLFRPERWLNVEGKAERDRYYFSFGGGTRSCIGQNITWMEVGKVIPALILNFEIELVYPEKELELVSGGSVHAADFWVRFKKRSST